jgi:hypothetical protein
MTALVELPLGVDVPTEPVADLLRLAYGPLTPAFLSLELSRLVPHLHPVEATERFQRLVEACADLRTFAMRQAAGSLPEEVSPTDAVLRVEHRAGLVASAVTHLLRPSVVDGTRWSGLAETAVAA